MMKLLRKLWRKLKNWDPIYWIRCHTWTRYHMLNVANATHGYKWGWMDRSEYILFANMAILVDFVEKEHAFDDSQPFGVDWDYNDEFKHAKKEFLEIYNWWKTERKKEQEALENESLEHYRQRDTLPKLPPEKIPPNPPGLVRLWADTDTETPEYKAYMDKVTEFANREEALYKKDEEMMIRLIHIRGHMWT